jgi:hypothetical protein
MSGHDTNGYSVSTVTPGLVPGIHVFSLVLSKEDVDGRDIGVRKHVVLRTTMPGHDNIFSLVLGKACRDERR